jgi:hypothetical protein
MTIRHVLTAPVSYKVTTALSQIRRASLHLARRLILTCKYEVRDSVYLGHNERIPERMALPSLRNLTSMGFLSAEDVPLCHLFSQPFEGKTDIECVRRQTIAL